MFIQSMVPRLSSAIFFVIISINSLVQSSAFSSLKMTKSNHADATSKAEEQIRIGYTSDIEGHWEYFLDYVSRSNVLEWEQTEGPFHRLKLQPNTQFVYGGDAIDKGPGDIRLCRLLVGLKQRYPDRVHLLVGNRDLNKIRFSTELSDHELGLNVGHIGRPFWDRNAPSYKEYLESNKDGRTIEEIHSKAEKLKWMLKHTMGCPDTFELRREELGVLKSVHGQYPHADLQYDATVISNVELDESITVSDEEVEQSFEYEINHPLGSLRQYLKHASIAAIVGNTVFVHGAVDALTMKYVPPLTSKFKLPTSVPTMISALATDSAFESTIHEGRIVENVHEWVDALNEYLQQGLKDFETRPLWNEDRSSRGGEALLAIQNRPSMWGRSVVCNSYGDGGVISTPRTLSEQKDALRDSIATMNPLVFEGTASNVFDPKPADWLLDHGIRRVVVGHKPTGDCPSVLSAAYTGVEVVSADTSYSHRKELESDNDAHRFGECRGKAISVVEVVGSEHSNWLETSGILACGKEYSNRFPMLCHRDSDVPLDADLGDKYLGRRLRDGWWVKALVSECYHLCRGSGRFVEYEVRSVEDVITSIENI